MIQFGEGGGEFGGLAVEFGVLQRGADAGVLLIVAEFFEFEEAVAEFDPAHPLVISKDGQAGTQDEDGGVPVAKAGGAA